MMSGKLTVNLTILDFEDSMQDTDKGTWKTLTLTEQK